MGTNTEYSEFFIIIDKSRQWADTLYTLINDKLISDSPCIRLSAPLCYLSVRHFSAVVLLCEHDLYGPAFALLRAQFESYIRSAWLYHSATEIQLHNIVTGKKNFPDINTMLKSLKNTNEGEFANLDKAKDIIWKTMNDFTHGGLNQIFMHSRDRAIEQNITQAHTYGLLKNSSTLGLMAGVLMMTMANNITIGENLMKSFKRIFTEV